MREAQGMPDVVVRKPPLSAKALLQQKYGDKACFKVDEVSEPVENCCPGLAIPQRDRVLYRCHLEIPGCSVTSEKFTKKKDADQAAAKMALEKLRVVASISRHLYLDQVMAFNPKWALAIESLESGSPSSEKSFGMQQHPDGDIDIDDKFWEEDFDILNCTL